MVYVWLNRQQEPKVTVSALYRLSLAMAVFLDNFHAIWLWSYSGPRSSSVCNYRVPLRKGLPPAQQYHLIQ